MHGKRLQRNAVWTQTGSPPSAGLSAVIALVIDVILGAAANKQNLNLIRSTDHMQQQCALLEDLDALLRPCTRQLVAHNQDKVEYKF